MLLPERAAEFLKRSASRSHSKVLAQLASSVAADPFVKVRGMIKDMIARLTQEANEEADHKAWCDGELKANKLTRDEKTRGVNEATALKEQLTADIMQLTSEIADLSKEIAQVEEALRAATEQRQKEHAKNAETVKDAQAGQEAVAQALVVLKEFYSKAATATSFVQGFQDDAPASFDTPYQGMGGSSEGVIGMLNVIHSDFARLEADTTSAEAEGARSFDEFSAASKEDLEQLNNDVESKDAEKTSKARDLESTEQTLAATQDELNAANAYYGKLKPTCLDAGVKYAERVEQREEEIESLRGALKILNDE